MLTRHARISTSATIRLFTTSAEVALKAVTTRSAGRPSWLETKGRTRSFLFDEDNPVTNKEAHKLHKVHLVDWNVKGRPELVEVLESHDVRTWQSNPYLSMLASPIRKCMWSDKVMPRDFLIPIKAALLKSEAETGKEQESQLKDIARISIFPRSLLHPAFVSMDESKGKKDNRGYVVCKKSAVYDFGSKGAWKRLERGAMPNPYLVYQVESQLRERVLQELKLLSELASEKPPSKKATDMHSNASSTSGKKLFAYLPKASISKIQEIGMLSQVTLEEASKDINVLEGSCDPPAALLDFTTPASKSSLVPEGQFSNLMAYQPSSLEGYKLQHLPQHRIPVYSISRLFELDLAIPKEANQGDEKTQPSSPEKKGNKAIKKEGELPLWSDLNHGQNSQSAREKRDVQIYEGEVEACQKRRAEFDKLVSGLTATDFDGQGLDGAVVAVSSMSANVVPLLKALWRYRMWIGEGWSGDGFGVLEATGRKKAT